MLRDIDWFQFLIGRLQTDSPFRPSRQFIRFNSSQVGYKLPMSCEASCISIRRFNSSQVGYKLAYPPFLAAELLLRFQFLIGRLQTQHCRFHLNCLLYCFNSSQVGYKLHFVFMSISPYPWFQFLIGRLQTIGNTVTTNTTITKFQFLIGRLQTTVVAPYLRNRPSFNSSQVGYKLILG